MSKRTMYASYLLCLLSTSMFTLPVYAVEKKIKPIVSVKASITSAPLSVEGDTLTIVRSMPCTIKAPEGTTNTTYTWLVPSVVTYTKYKNTIVISSAPNGTHRIMMSMVTIDFDKKTVITDEGSIDLVIGNAPTPTPTPPTPTPTPPTPTDLPIKGDGLRVLIIEESSKRTELPAAQRLIITSKMVRDYLKSKCTTDTSAGDGHAWRIWDPDASTDKEPQFWGDALKRAKDKSSSKYPWIAIGNGKDGYEGPLPDSVDKMMELLKKYGG